MDGVGVVGLGAVDFCGFPGFLLLVVVVVEAVVVAAAVVLLRFKNSLTFLSLFMSSPAANMRSKVLCTWSLVKPIFIKF